MAKKIIFLLLALVLMLVVSRETYNMLMGTDFFRLVASEKENYEMNKTNIKIFKDTAAWDLAVAVYMQDVRKIRKIAERNPEILDFKQPYYCVTLLMWAVGMEKYKSAEALLKSGADPNMVADGTEIYKALKKEAAEKGDWTWYINTPKPFNGETALYIASGYSWVDYQAKKDPKYVKLLLKYGADPNIYFTDGMGYFEGANGRRMLYGTEAGMSPLINSINCGIEKTKALVEGGADIDHKTESGETAAICSLRWYQTATIRARQYSYYLIVEKGAKVTDPYYTPPLMYLDSPQDEAEGISTYYPVDLLRRWMPKLDSEEYRMKMEVVDEFVRQGVDYWATEIQDNELETIKKLYPDTWEEYIKVY